MLYVQAVELRAGSGYHSQSVRGHTVAVGKLEEGEPRTGLAYQLSKTKVQWNWGRAGQATATRKETRGWHRSVASALTPFLPMPGPPGAPTSSVSLVEGTTRKENQAGIPMGQR